MMLIIITSLLLTGCCPCRQLVDVQDSLRVEVIERVVKIHDTVIYEVPTISDGITTTEQESHLENELAESDARINADGTLTHSLATKPQSIKIGITIPTLRRDSVIYRNSYRTIEVERDRSWWEQTQINGFWAMLAILSLIIILRKIKRILF